MKNFLRVLLKSANPWQLRHLSHRHRKDNLKFLLLLVLISFVLMCIVTLPKIIGLPDYLSGKFSSFEKFEVNLTTEMKEPIVFTESKPEIIVDTTGTYTNLSKERLLITKDRIFYRFLFKEGSIKTGEYKDLLGKKDELSNLATIMVILAMPSVLLISYVLYVIKYFLISLLFSFIAFFTLKLIRYKLKFKDVYTMSIYALFYYVLLDVLFIPFNVGVYLSYLPLLLYIICFIFGICTLEKVRVRI